MWTTIHHYIYTTVKIALTYDVAHNRPCSQPGFLVLVSSRWRPRTCRTAWPNSRTWKSSTRSTAACQSSSCSRALRPGCSRRFASSFSLRRRWRAFDTMLAHLFADADMRWGFTHTEWYYLLGDIVWCTGAVFLKVLGTMLPADGVYRHRLLPPGAVYDARECHRDEGAQL